MTSAAPSRAARTLATLLVSLAACHTSGIAPTSRSAVQDTALINRDITYLASEALEGRGTGTAGNDTAAAYISREYASLGLAAEPNSGEACPSGFTPGFACSPKYQQRFYATSVAAAHAGLSGSLPTQNVVAIVKGSDPALAGEYVVFGAHFDHLGRNTFGAMDPDAGNSIRPGADDNASGTAAVMELARIFAKHPTKRSIMFINFSGEELGTLGSQYFVEHAPIPLDSILVMLNFDMIGRLRDDKLLVYGVATATQLKPLVDSMNLALGHVDSTKQPVGLFNIAAMGDGFGPSDHASFYGAGVPVLHFFTDVHEDYHKSSDVASKINIIGEAQVIDYAAALGRELGDRPSKLTFVKSAAPVGRGPGMGNGTWFGSVPDMGAAGIVGVKLSGVTPGSPADSAGARKGDVIVEFGGDPINDIYEFTSALAKHHPGETIQVVVMREGQRVTLTATLGKRSG
jgi:hypothetical protein